MKLTSLVVAGSLLGCLSSCAVLNSDTAKLVADTATISLEIPAFRQNLAQVIEAVEAKQKADNTFTTDEWGKLKNVVDTVSVLALRAELIYQLKTPTSMTELKGMYDIAKREYLVAKTIIQGKMPTLSPATQILLSSLDTEAQLIDIGASKLSDKLDSTSMSDLTSFIFNALTLTTKIMALSAL
jgi:hypothetical protein